MPGVSTREHMLIINGNAYIIACRLRKRIANHERRFVRYRVTACKETQFMTL